MPRRSWPHGATASRACGRPSPKRRVSDQRGRLLVAALGFAATFYTSGMEHSATSATGSVQALHQTGASKALPLSNDGGVT